jgi:hypothetical protein
MRRLIVLSTVAAALLIAACGTGRSTSQGAISSSGHSSRAVGTYGLPATTPASSVTPVSLVTTTANCSRTSVGFTALTDLGQGTYRGFQGGLYSGGRNTPPTQYLDEGLSAAGQVRPLAANGAPSSSGRIVLLSIGMSNASDEFRHFIGLAATDSALEPQEFVEQAFPQAAPVVVLHHTVMVVNGAVPDFDATRVLSSPTTYLGIVDDNLAAAGATPEQVQAVWLKEAIGNEHESFPTDAEHLQQDLDAIIAILTRHFPNLRLVYLSSRIYAGYAVSPLNPEPFAYESGFAVKWTVAGRVAQPQTRPWVAWGPYLWADGLDARKDGLTWACSDFETDGTHPSPQGAEKVANMLLSFFTSNPTTQTWFNTPR